MALHYNIFQSTIITADELKRKVAY